MGVSVSLHVYILWSRQQVTDRQTDRQTDKNAIAVSPSRSCAMPTKIVQSGSGVTGLLAAKSSGQVLLYFICALLFLMTAL